MEATALESVDAVTPEWTTAVLAQNGIAATVCRVTTEPVGTGQMGSCYRLFIGYDAGDGPDRLIVKLPATDPASRAAIYRGVLAGMDDLHDDLALIACPTLVRRTRSRAPPGSG